MTVHQCPKCELRFDWKTELEDHCWHDHPEFRHDYPAVTVPEVAEPAPVVVAQPVERPHRDASELFRWLRPAHSKDAAAQHPRE